MKHFNVERLETVEKKKKEGIERDISRVNESDDRNTR
jgi:hypothetical protein